MIVLYCFFLIKYFSNKEDEYFQEEPAQPLHKAPTRAQETKLIRILLGQNFSSKLIISVVVIILMKTKGQN